MLPILPSGVPFDPALDDGLEDAAVATTRRKLKKEDADRRRGLGRSRGGLNTKIHGAVEKRGHLAAMSLSLGQDGDGPHVRELLKLFEPGPIEHVVADTADDGDEMREQIRKLKAKACIKPHKKRTIRKYYDKERYKNRNQIERFFNRIKQFLRVATRHEKTLENFAGFIWPAALIVDIL
ncbi:MAG TPA: IS5 family transposase [Planctomicrobium sp.]|nr:IS5 family transposase [Planctomicrobium sp.]